MENVLMKIVMNLNKKLFDSNLSNIFRILLITLLLASIFLLVYTTGGSPNTNLHLIYIPIIISAYYWGVIGGISVAIISGTLTCQLIPSNVSNGIVYSDADWIIQLLVLTLVGLVTGYIFMEVNKLSIRAKEYDFINLFTGMYNINKLICNLEERMNNSEKFVIISIKLTNIEEISKYIEPEFANDIAKKLSTELLVKYGKDAVYTSGHDEIDLVIYPNSGYLEECKQILKQYTTAFKLNQFSIRIAMKIGIYEYDGTDETPINVYNKARIAYEQGTEQETDIYFYNKEFEINRKKNLEILGSLLESINNNELYLTYQPKINIADDTICGVEVLTRWDRGEKRPVGPDVFIKLAEDIGFINQISKFVFEKSLNQIANWRSKGISLSFSINCTANELLDDNLIEWERKINENNKLNLSMFIIEITERIILVNNDKIKDKIEELRAKGIRISIDDFGTGFNSLIRVMEFPFDEIKISKYFIDNIINIEIRMMIKAIIDLAHKFNKTVVAEGVETQEQLNILREIKCDIAQGYYYSKPLTADEFEKYYLGRINESKGA
jgi:EAL domain-containing protein (putative c-di-GMP-specific phosphodiesterase class I)